MLRYEDAKQFISMRVCEKIPQLGDLRDDDGLLKLSGDMLVHARGIEYGEYLLLFDDGLEPLILNHNLQTTIGEARGAGADIRVKINEEYVLPASERNCFPFELERWYGPAFSKDALDKDYSPNVTAHFIRTNAITISGKPPHRTEFWLYGQHPDRTIEIEDLVLFNLAPKGVNTKFCHAIWNTNSSKFSHFDLATIFYEDIAYRDRTEITIDERQRDQIKTKLLRMDGISLDIFKRAITQFHKHNPLISEYFSGNIGFNKGIQDTIGIIADENLRNLRLRIAKT